MKCHKNYASCEKEKEKRLFKREDKRRKDNKDIRLSIKWFRAFKLIPVWYRIRIELKMWEDYENAQ